MLLCARLLQNLATKLITNSPIYGNCMQRIGSLSLCTPSRRCVCICLYSKLTHSCILGLITSFVDKQHYSLAMETTVTSLRTVLDFEKSLLLEDDGRLNCVVRAHATVIQKLSGCMETVTRCRSQKSLKDCLTCIQLTVPSSTWISNLPIYGCWTRVDVKLKYAISLGQLEPGTLQLVHFRIYVLFRQIFDILDRFI